MTPPIGPDEDRLRYALAFVDGHVKFAETKNAALLTANAATLVAVLQVLTGGHAGSPLLGVYLVLLAAASLVSGVVALLSFLPVTQLPWLDRPRRSERRGNLLFFGDAQRHDAQNYLAELAAATGAPPGTRSALDHMLAAQIIVNAKISARKFTYFAIALWSTLFGVLTPVLGAVLLWWVLGRRPA